MRADQAHGGAQASGELPTGTVTYLFTDVEGSTRLWEQHPAAMRQALARHDVLIEELVARHGGVVVRPRGEGDSRFAVFARATDAVAAAAAVQQALCAEPWPAEAPVRVRLALHTGEADLREGDYYGGAVNRCARLRAIAHGGQALLSQATHDLVRDALPAGILVRDLGLHRLADLQRAEQVYQLLPEGMPADFPPLRSLEAIPNNLPLQLTSFVGREREMAEVRGLQGGTRLLTLTGTGGTGKTRLALQVVADLLQRYPQGVWLVELAAIADPALVPLAVATALGLREEAGQPATATLVAALRPRHLLLVLDNCEHVLDACAALAEALVRACPHVHILATSREALGLGGETAWRVPSLALPDVQHLPAPEELLQVEAVRLFVERARTAQPLFTVTAKQASAVAQVCRRLDGIPLALELAAARLRGLSIDELATRLDQRFRLLTGGSRTALPRQQTLQAAVDWSYSLLSAPEQTLFTRLAVFTGGFTLEAAEAVCAGGPVPAEEVLDLVLRLVDKSLVAVEGESAGRTRYRLLETLRQYGRERLVARGEAEALYHRHFAHYRDMAEQVALIFREMQQAVLGRLEAEHENLRQALGWALDLGEAQEGLRLVNSLWPRWWYDGQFGEGRRWLEALLALPGAATRTATRAWALYLKALLTLGTARLVGRYWQGAGERRALHEEALAIACEVGDEDGQAWNLVFLGHSLGLADYAGARSRLEEGLALAIALGDRYVAHLALGVLGVVAWAQGDRDVAHRWCTQSLRHSERDRDQDGYARALHDLAAMTFQEGDAARARRQFEESLAIFRELHDRMGMALVLGMLGVVAATQGESALARVCFVEKRALWEQVGERSGIAAALRDLGWLERREGAMAQARARYEEALGLERDLRDDAGIGATLAGLGDVTRDAGDHAEAAAHYAEALAVLRGSEAHNERAVCLEGLAAVAWAGGDAARAARLCGAAAAARLPDLNITPISLVGCTEVVEATRAALGEAQFAAAYAEGEALTLEQAIALASVKHPNT
jgi:predicted ATPase/class 3 adenylate cyclase